MQFLLIAAILFVFLFIRIRKSYNDPVWRLMPGPKHKLPFFGLAFDLVSSDASSLHSLWATQFGSIFRYYVIGMNTVMVSDPAVVKYVLLNNHLFDKNIFHYRYLAKALGNGLVTEWDEAKHKYHRSIVSPAFAHHHLRVLVPIFQKKGAILVEDWQTLADTNTPVSIKDFIAKATSDVIGEAAFGYQLNSQRDNSPSSVYNIFSAVMGNGYAVLQAVPGVRLMTSTYYRRTAAIKKLDEQVNVMIAQKTENRAHKAKEEEREKEKEKEQKDLLDIMMDCQNEDGAMLTKAELNDQTKTFLMAGYETSSVCILWTMYLLAKHPDIQQKLADEVHRVLGKNKQPSAEDIDEMPYLYKVLRESLRFYPPIPLVVRQASEDLTLGGYNISKGTIITVNIFHQHRHSPVWVDPDTFNPERWSNDESETAHLIGSYVPFIMGARNCIGSRFAMLEVRVIIAMIVQKLKFTLVPGSAVPRPIARISMVPRDPIHILFSLRE